MGEQDDEDQAKIGLHVHLEAAWIIFATVPRKQPNRPIQISHHALGKV